MTRGGSVSSEEVSLLDRTVRHHLDVKHLICPMPVIKLQDLAKQLSSGEQIEMVATDPGVKADIPTWCEINNHQILTSADLADGSYRFVIEVGEET